MGACQEWVLGVTDSSTTANPAVAAGLPADILGVRWLPHCSVVDLFEQYQHRPDVSADNTASLSVFQKVWSKWNNVALKIRAVNQHARCFSCAKFCKYRVLAQTEAERAAVQEAYNEHLRGVFRDRDISASLALASEKSCSASCREGHRVLYISMDSMDQAKFKCPRPCTTDDNKMWEGLWRPALHNTCLIFHGICEVYFVSNADLKKDSNFQLTCLSRMLSCSRLSP